MIRHLVLFTWSESADEAARTRAVAALRRLREDVGGMSELTVAEDAGLTAGNAHAVLIADFPDAAAFATYAADPRHQAVLVEHVRPILAARSAVQIEA